MFSWKTKLHAHMINRIYHHITLVTRESHPSGVTLICKFRVVDVANHGNENGILLSLPQCDDWLFSPTSLIFYKKPDFNVVWVLQSTTPLYSFLWLYHAICPHVAGGTRESEQVSKIYKPRRGLQQISKSTWTLPVCTKNRSPEPFTTFNFPTFT